MSKKPESELKDIELEPNAWERFERAVDAAVKSGPKHRTSKAKSKQSKNPAKRKAVEKSS